MNKKINKQSTDLKGMVKKLEKQFKDEQNKTIKFESNLDKEKSQILALNEILNEEKEKNEKSPNHSLKELIKKGKKTNFISIRETGNYTKKIDKKDKVKLMNLVKALKNSDI